jgi:WD40 repeat protein
LSGHEGPVISVAFSPTGNGRLASGSSDKTIRLWNADTGELARDPLRGHNGDITAIAFSRNGERIASGSNDHTIRIWNVGNSAGRKLHVVKVQPEPMIGVFGFVGFISQPGRDTDSIISLMHSNSRSVIHRCDVRTGVQLGGAICSRYNTLSAIALGPSDGTFICASSSGTAAMLGSETGKLTSEPIQLGMHSKPSTALAWSPNGKRVLCAFDSKEMDLWDADTQKTKFLLGHAGVVLSVAFSSDSERAASGASDGTVRIWDAETGETIVGPLRGHRGAVISVAFSPDGRHLVSGGADGSVKVWDTELSPLSSKADEK